MAQDAEIKIILNTQEFIKQAKSLAPELQKALDVKSVLPGIEKYQTALKQMAKDKDALNKKGELTGPFSIKQLEKYETKFKGLFDLADKWKNVSEKLEDLGIKDGAEKQGLKSLQGKIGAAVKLGGTGEAERADYNRAKELVNQKAALEAVITTEYNKQKDAFDKMKSKVEDVVNTENEHKTAIVKINEAYSKVQEQATKEASAANENADAHKQVAKDQESITSETKADVDATKQDIDATEDLASAKAKAAEQTVTPEEKAAVDKETVSDTENLTDKVEQTKNEFIDLISVISNLRNASEDATTPFNELVSKLREFDTATASMADLAKYLGNVGEALDYITKKLNFPDNLKDVFNALKEATIPAKKAQTELAKEAAKTGNDVVKAATLQSEVAKIYAMVSAAEQQRVERRKQLQDILDAQTQKEIQHTQAGATAIIAAVTQEQTEFQNAMQSIIDMTDRVENAMRFDTDTTNIAELIRQLKELEQAKATLEGYGLPKEMDARYALILRLLEMVNQKVKEYKQSISSADTASKNFGKNTAKSGKQASKGLSGLSSLCNTLTKGFKDLSKSTGHVKSNFNSLARTMKSNLKHMITSITKYVLGFRSLFFLVRRLRKYIGEGIKNMAQFNDGNNIVNESITRLLSSLLYLKNAWATAFSPILSVVTPMLERLIDRLADAGNAFSRFLGRLLGSGNVFQAVKVDAADYADSLDKAAGSAGSAADKTKKLTDRLAAFDDLNVLGKDNDPDKTGSGGGGGSADAYEPNPNDMFKILEVADDLKQKLLSLWGTEDIKEFGDKFKGLGETIAQNLKQALVDLNGKWPEIQEDAHRIGVAIGALLSGLLSDPTLFEEAGKAVAEGLDTIGQAISGFFETYEKGSIGSALASFFRGVFANFDFGTAGANVGDFATTLFTELATFLKEFPHEEVVQGIEDFFGGIQWNEVVASIFSLIGATAGFVGAVAKGFAHLLTNIKSDDIVKAFEEVDWKDVADGIGELLGGAIALTFTSIELPLTIAKAIIQGLANAWIDAMKEGDFWDQFVEGCEDIKEGDTWGAIVNIGEALVGGLAEGIANAFVDGVTWVEEHIAGPLVEGFKSCFDIHSPSGVFEDFGEDLMNGLINGIANLIPNITKKFENLKTDLTTIWQNIRTAAFEKFTLMRVAIVEVFNALKDAVKTPINGFLGIIESMVNKVIGGINSMVSALNTLPDIKFTNPFTGTEYKLGFTLPKLNTITIPRLAQGAVIPPNREFMAVLGDQSHGTNVEAPLDVIKQAVAEVLANNGNAEVIQLLQQLITVVERKELKIGDKEIGKANARYNAQQNLIRGVNF